MGEKCVFNQLFGLFAGGWILSHLYYLAKINVWNADCDESIYIHK